MIDIPIAMHIPDGFLSPGVAAIAGVLAIAAVAYGLRVANVELDESFGPATLGGLVLILAGSYFAAGGVVRRRRSMPDAEAGSAVD